MPLLVDGKGYLLGRGAVFFKLAAAAGVASGYRFLGSVKSLELDVSERDTLEARSFVTAAASVVRELITKFTPKFRMTLQEANADNVALAMMGEVVAYTQAATPITNEVFADVKQGTYIKLAKRGPISSVVVEPAGGGTAFTLTTDYTIEDATVPLIYIVPGGGIADAADIQVDYTPTAVVAPGLKQVRVGNKNFIEGALLYVPDPASGPKLQTELWKVSLLSTAVLPLIQGEDEFAEFDLEGKILADSAHPNDPYGVQTEVGSV